MTKDMDNPIYGLHYLTQIEVYTGLKLGHVQVIIIVLLLLILLILLKYYESLGVSGLISDPSSQYCQVFTLSLDRHYKVKIYRPTVRSSDAHSTNSSR